ncbi:MAG: WYL domain-containing protein [Ruminiclostridium sp.]|nr:WYL domain-containing protein [Ruminiclostridium sp.]
MPHKDFNLTEYLSSTFSMFSGKSEPVKLKFHSSLANAVIDRFGKDVTFYPYPEDNEHFNITVQIKTETPEPFFGWLFQFGNKVHILSPESLRERYKKMLSEVLADN